MPIYIALIHVGKRVDLLISNNEKVFTRKSSKYSKIRCTPIYLGLVDNINTYFYG